MTEKALRELLQLINQPGEPVKPFEIRSYGKSELAMLYFPDAKTKKGAMNNLNYWIDFCTVKARSDEASRNYGTFYQNNPFIPQEKAVLSSRLHRDTKWFPVPSSSEPMSLKGFAKHLRVQGCAHP